MPLTASTNSNELKYAMQTTITEDLMSEDFPGAVQTERSVIGWLYEKGNLPSHLTLVRFRQSMRGNIKNLIKSKIDGVPMN